jgi:hypothetical protein
MLERFANKIASRLAYVGFSSDGRDSISTQSLCWTAIIGVGSFTARLVGVAQPGQTIAASVASVTNGALGVACPSTIRTRFIAILHAVETGHAGVLHADIGRAIRVGGTTLGVVAFGAPHTGRQGKPTVVTQRRTTRGVCFVTGHRAVGARGTSAGTVVQVTTEAIFAGFSFFTVGATRARTTTAVGIRF